MTPTDELVERVAHAIWRSQVADGPSGILRRRTIENFREINPDALDGWKCDARAAIAAMQPTVAQAALIEAIQKLGLRALVAGWNGENREDGPFDPHPAELGVTLITNAGTVYAIDAALRALTETPEDGE